jgi:translation initiation factor IF-3
MDFGKYQYEKAKREREARKSRKEIEVKEVRLRPKTDEHDVNFKVRQARAFLESGAKVRIRMRFRGREIYNLDVATKQFDHFARELADVGTIEKRPSFEGRTMLMIVAPNTSRK